MADNAQDDDLFNDLMSSMGEAEQSKVADAPKVTEKSAVVANTNSEKAEEPVSFFKKYFTKEKISSVYSSVKARLENAWQLPFMILSMIGAAYVWLVLPSTVVDEDRIQKPQWWFNKALEYYHIAEDKGLENNFSVGDFSRYEFRNLSFEKQKELLKEVNKIADFNSKPSEKNQNHFINTFVNDLNKLLLDEKLVNRIPKDKLEEVDEDFISNLEQNILKLNSTDEDSSLAANKSFLKLYNRQLMENVFTDIPKYKPARFISARYFRYVFDKHRGVYNQNMATDLLKAADVFQYVLRENISRKDRLNAYLQVSKKNDPFYDSQSDVMLGGEGAKKIGSRLVNDEMLSPDDQAHLEYQLANLYFDLDDNLNAQKYFKRFLNLALEKASEGYERRLEKGVLLQTREKNIAIHREITPEKISLAYYKIGKLQFDHESQEEAKVNFEKFIGSSIIADPEKSFMAYEMLGDIYFGMKNYEKALSYYRQALAINAITTNVKNPVKYKAGLSHFKLGNFPQSIKRFIQVKGTGEYGKHNAAALFYTGKATMLLGDEEEAVVLFKKVHERYPLSNEDISATFEIAKYHYRQGLYDISFSEPINDGEEKTFKNDFSVLTLLQNPKERFLNNEFINVDEILTEPDSNSTEIGLLYDLANKFTAEKKYEKAIDVYKVMTTNPIAIHQMGKKRDKLYFDMARIWSDNNLPIRAGETLEIMLEKIPDSPFYSKALWDICKYYMSVDDYSRAIKPLKSFVSQFFNRPESPEAYYLLGICEQKVGAFSEAIRNYNLAYGYNEWKQPKIFDEKTGKETLDLSARDPYFVFNREEKPIDRNFFAYQAILQKGRALKDAGYYDEAIDHVYQTVFNDPLYRFKPNSEIWKNSLLVYAEAYFKKGWLEKEDLKAKHENYKIAQKNYLDYMERYQFKPTYGLGKNFDKEQKRLWEMDDVIKFDIHFNLAHIRFEMEDYAGSRNYFADIVKWKNLDWTFSNRDDKKKDSYIMVPMTFYKEKKWREAISSFREAKDRYSTSPEAPILGLRIAECLQQLGDFEGAKQEFETSKWILESINKGLYENKPGEINKSYLENLIASKQDDLLWQNKQ